MRFLAISDTQAPVTVDRRTIWTKKKEIQSERRVRPPVEGG